MRCTQPLKAGCHCCCHSCDCVQVLSPDPNWVDTASPQPSPPTAGAAGPSVPLRDGAAVLQSRGGR